MKIALLILSLTTSHAAAHEAVTGWAYPSGCCSQVDCRIVPDDAITKPTMKRQSYTINRTKEVIKLGDPKLRESPDGKFHWCSVSGADDGNTRCLFVPQMGL